MAVTWISSADLSDPASPYAESAIKTASWILYKLTAEKYPGIQTVTEWYGLPASRYSCFCTSGATSIGVQAGLLNHYHYYVESPEFSRQVRLRRRPVRSINTIVDSSGRTLDSSEYYIVNSAYIIKSDSSNWNLSSGFVVNYTYGSEPPEAGKRAAVKFAEELILAATNPDECAIPKNVTSVNRRGFSFEIFDPQSFIAEGRTGIYEVDLFIATANPNRAKKRPRVFSPDLPRGERRV